MRLNIVYGRQGDPYLNLAVENEMLEHGTADATLFLWQNDHTVVIGANQNPFSECSVDALLADGGKVSRRRTGGGAVYHDLGNINFSFIVNRDLYDVSRQMSVIQKALLTFGIVAEVSGRNDITVDGRKFSGNAFRLTSTRGLHHGTILIKSDYTKISKYLKVNPAKLQKHGVKSVASRVVNLSELTSINAASLLPRLTQAFGEVYGGTPERVEFDTLINERVLADARYISSNAYLFDKWRRFSTKKSAIFDWGLVEIDLTIDEERGRIETINLSSDALDAELINEAELMLTGAKIHQRPSTNKKELNDILSIIYI